MKKKLTNFEIDFLQRLKDPEFSIGLLNEALKENDKRVFLIVLRDVVEAHGGMSKFAKLMKISREHIYRMLSSKGNPEFQTLQLLLNALGFKITLEPKEKLKKAA